jgi:hypothetical protein
MQVAPTKNDKKKLHGSHEQVSDIEYIIPRVSGGAVIGHLLLLTVKNDI